MDEQMQSARQENGSTSSKKPSMLYLLIAGCGVALVLGLVGWYVVGIQNVKKLSESNFAVTTARLFHIPVASINGVKIGYDEYVDNLQAMRKFFDTDTTGTITRPSDQEMSDYVLSRLLVNELIAQVAREYSLVLNASDIDSIVENNLLQSFESREKAEEEIMNRYGWTLNEFVEKIVVPTELERKLSEVYLAAVQDTSRSEAVRVQAEQVLKRIQDGESFELLAKEFGSDGTSEQGGDLGWFGRDVMVPEFEQAVFALKKGETANTLVETQFGYHIIRLDDTRVTKDATTGESVDEVKARHILFRFPETDTTAFREFMNDKLMTSTIQVSKGLRNPFEALFAEENVGGEVVE